MRRLALVVVAALAVGCKPGEKAAGPPRDGKLGAQRCTGQPGPKNKRLPVLQRPFDGQYPVYNLFDHDTPQDIRPNAAGDREQTYCGLEALGLAEGYPGYAFGMPEGTPVLAAADGEVIFAGVQAPFPCPLTMRRVEDQLSVDVRHDTLGGIGFITRYVHLKAGSVLVKVGDKVVAGQRVGVSGKTGCALGPLLYFEVKRLTGTKQPQPTVVDPYGWDGPSPDPWAEHEKGAESLYLWRDGEAPSLKAK